MSTTTTTSRPARNGVDVPTLFATLDVVRAQPAAAQFQFRARNEWVSGTHSRTAIQGFFGAGQEDTTRTEPFVYDADHPAVLVGGGNGPTPVEFLLHAIASCLTAGLVNIASARGITLHRVESTVEGDIDLLGIFGMSDEVRNGYREIRVHFTVDGVVQDPFGHSWSIATQVRSLSHDEIRAGLAAAMNAPLTKSA